MKGERWSPLWSGLLSALLTGWLGVSAANCQQVSPTNEDVDRAIRACSVGMQTKTRAKFRVGLTSLKLRIISGEGIFERLKIPSVIGSGVQTPEAMIMLFDLIQQCVVVRVYGIGRVPTDFTGLWCLVDENGYVDNLRVNMRKIGELEGTMTVKSCPSNISCVNPPQYTVHGFYDRTSGKLKFNRFKKGFQAYRYSATFRVADFGRGYVTSADQKEIKSFVIYQPNGACAQ